MSPCVALAHPLVLCNLAYGQNGLFTASLLTLGACWSTGVRFSPGICFGLLAYKPQFAAWRRCSCCSPAGAPASRLPRDDPDALPRFAGAVRHRTLDRLPGHPRRDQPHHPAEGDGRASTSTPARFGAVRLLGGPMAAAWAVQAVVARAGPGPRLPRLATMPPTLNCAPPRSSPPARCCHPTFPVYDLARSFRRRFCWRSSPTGRAACDRTSARCSAPRRSSR